ncbi:MAG: pitrilysin family protein [Candidatus Aminicenantes bacterium]|nr:pitrilysin family protein [Candidatus Aminicenantes bacterium]
MKYPRTFRLSFILFLALAMAGSFLAGQNLEDKVHARTLGNGMTVILVERHGAPVFSTIYGFKVGSVDEIQGITGTAHLFEHMAFKGTPRIGTSDFEKEKPIMEKVNQVGREWSLELVKGELADKEKLARLREELTRLEAEQKKFIVKDEIDVLYSNVGGTGLNAGTGTDQTMYIINLPANQLELFCLIESERIRNTVLREFYTERSVIQEERKQTTDASPARLLNEMFMGAAFLAHPYNHPVVGWASDIASVTLEEAQAFKNKYYTPNNCVLAIAGDVYPEKAWPLIEKYFGDIPRGEDPPVLRTVEPKQLGERRVRFEFDAEPMLMMGFHKPTFPSKEDAAASVLASILTSGRTSRMNKDLVQEKQIAVSVSASAGGGGVRYPNLFTFNATPRFPHTVEEVEKAILEHIEKVKTEPVSERELQKVKNSWEASYIRQMSSNMGLAMMLTRYQLLFGDWKLYLKYKDLLTGITAADVMDFAKTTLTPENRTVAFLVKKAKAN